jgi:hypothetical protein
MDKKILNHLKKQNDKFCSESFVKFSSNTQIGNGNNMCLMICGQLRSFCQPEVNESLKDFISLLKHKFNVVCFFLINKNSSFELVEWHFNRLVELGFYDTIESCHEEESLKFEEQSKQNKINANKIINNLGVDVNVEYYDDNYASSKSNVFSLRDDIITNCYEQVKKYEIDNNIQFDYVTYTRPDLTYNKKVTNVLVKNMSNNFIFSALDCFKFYPKNIFNYILENKVKLNEVEKIFKNKKTSSWYFNHYNDMISLELSNVESAGYKIEYAFVMIWPYNILVKNKIEIGQPEDYFCEIQR